MVNFSSLLQLQTESAFEGVQLNTRVGPHSVQDCRSVYNSTIDNYSQSDAKFCLRLQVLEVSRLPPGLFIIFLIFPSPCPGADFIPGSFLVNLGGLLWS